MSESKLCISCMRQVPAEADHCPLCGYNGTQTNPAGSLPIGTRLSGSVVVGMQTDTDNETVTYAAYDLSTRSRVFVKEFCPKNGCEREETQLSAKTGAEIHYKTGLSDFCDLYTALRDMPDNSGLLRVLALRRENNTAYAVLEDFQGISLAEFLEIRKTPITAEQCLALMKGVFSAVGSIHAAKLIHRGISSETILLNKQGEVRLAGFSSAAVRTFGTEYPARLYEGYSAPEQYVPNAFASAATDVYALAACIYSIVSRTVPADAQKRKLLDDLKPLSELVPDIDPAFSRAVSAALVLDPKQRTASAAEFLAQLQGKVTGRAAKNRAEKPDKTKQSQNASASEQADNPLKKYIIMAAVSAGLLLIMVGVFFAWDWIKSTDGPQELPEPVDPVATTYVVPDFVGKDIFEDELVYTQGLRYQITYVYTDDVAVNTVVSMSPAQGTAQQEGTTVTIRISQGSRIVEIPNLYNLTPNNAAQVLEQLGVQYRLELVDDSSKIQGVIFWQSIKAGTKYNTSSGELILRVAS